MAASISSHHHDREEETNGNHHHHHHHQRLLISGKHRVCVFGSSANPPTGERGHVGIVRALASKCQDDDDDFDEIRVVPVYSHPFATKQKQLAPFEHRLNMCRLAFAQIPNVTISNAEQILYQRKLEHQQQQQQQQQEEEEKNTTKFTNISVGTADLLEYFCNEHQEECTLCLGTDTFLDLISGKWRRKQDILDLCQGRFVVLHRKQNDDAEKEEEEGSSSGEENQEQQEQQREKNERLQQEIDKLNEQYGAGSAQLLRVPTLGTVSSTLVRTASSSSSLNNKANSSGSDSEEQQRADRALKRSVTCGVFHYMVEHKLYGFGSAESD